MSADIDFERRVRSELRSTLERTAGPHPDWATSPAAAIVAADPAVRGRGVPWRLMAVAAVLVVGSVAALILASPDLDDAGVPGCPTLADYAAASAQPSPPLGEAPGVTFPPVAPTATMTTGLLRPGDWAVMANADGPGVQIRVRDVRDCGRLPDIRSNHQGGSIYLATVDVRFLRGNAGMGWLGPQSIFEGAVGGQQGSTHVGPVFGVPGTDARSWLDPQAGWAFSGTYILDVPRTEKQIAIDHPTNNTVGLPGLEVNDLDSPRARWVIRDGVPTGGEGSGQGSEWMFRRPGTTPTTGEIRLGDEVTFFGSDGSGVIRFSEVDEVPAYPGLLPATGNVFVEVLMDARSLGGPLVSPSDLRAIGADGGELAIVQAAPDGYVRVGLLPNLLDEPGSDYAWVVIEAPATGPVRLEYHHHGASDEMFWVQLRD
jgi:hypothetical protein